MNIISAKAFMNKISVKTTSTLETSVVYKSLLPASRYSGLPSERINLSPFTKDFRGGGHTMSLN